MKITSLGAILWPKDTRNWWINSFLSFLGEHFWGAFYTFQTQDLLSTNLSFWHQLNNTTLHWLSLHLYLTLPSPPLSFLNISSQPNHLHANPSHKLCFRGELGLRPLYCKRHFQSLEQRAHNPIPPFLAQLTGPRVNAWQELNPITVSLPWEFRIKMLISVWCVKWKTL